MIRHFSLAMVLFFGLSTIKAKAAGRFGEIVFTFPAPKLVTIEEDKSANAIILHFAGVHYRELEALENYDERLIKRVLVQDLGPQGTRVRFLLQDRHLRATIDQLQEPFRISLTIYDRDYHLETDPETSLPLSNENAPATKLDGQPSLFPAQELGVNTPRALIHPPSLSQALGTQEGAAKEASSSLPSNKEVAAKGGFKRRLLQPTPAPIRNSQELTAAFAKAGEGRGPEWKVFPYYVYPLQTAAYSGREQPAGWQAKFQQQALSDAQAMAELAYKMFTFGDEKRALVAYQQVIFREPAVFDKDPLHLWALAECHLGQGNLALADGYYDSLREKFPASPLADFASLRRLDIQSIKRLAAQQPELLAELLTPLNAIDGGLHKEFLAQQAIRMAYWLPPLPRDFHRDLPLASKEVLGKLAAVLPEVESKKTAFLGASILLKNQLQEPNPWLEETTKLAGAYTQTYDASTAKPFYAGLRKEIDQKLAQTLITESSQEQFAQVIARYEGLPVKLKEVSSQEGVAWALAEAYRNLGQLPAASNFYQQAAKKAGEGPGHFKALFWQAVLLGRIAEQEQLNQDSQAKAEKHRQKALTIDQQMARAWDDLSPQEQGELRSVYEGHLARTLQDKTLLTTPPRIILSHWEASLGTGVVASSGAEGAPQPGDGGSQAAAVRLLRDLSDRFRQLSRPQERHRATQLLKQLKPKAFASDRQAQNLWTDQLVALADEYREDNRYLEAGRLFAFTAEESIDWEGRAEAFYKGGLLLYRAGKRQEAIAALMQASQDGNNLFYANLAKERLTQLQQ